MNNKAFTFYSVLKNEDATPYADGQLIVAADGLGGAGSAVHAIDRSKFADIGEDIRHAIFNNLDHINGDLEDFINELIEPLLDDKDDTSALLASRIVMARCVHLLTSGGPFHNTNLADENERKQLSSCITKGLEQMADKFGLKKGSLEGQLLLPTTLAFIRYKEEGDAVVAETVWAGDSRCYALTPDGLKLLTVDDEDASGSITNLFYVGGKEARLNYLRYEIKMPCALMAVSDGVFDPFDPLDYIAVENTLLSEMENSSSPEDFAARLKKFYDGVHGDDATMAFVPFGFGSFEGMKAAFAQRAAEVESLCREWQEKKKLLEAENMSEEEASGYITGRTGDKFEYILSELVRLAKDGGQDIALTDRIKTAVEEEKSASQKAKKAAEKTDSQINKRLAELKKQFRNRPQNITSLFKLHHDKIDFGGNEKLKHFYTKMWDSAARFRVNSKNDEDAANATARKKDEFHERIMEKLIGYREKFDGLWTSREQTRDGHKKLKEAREAYELYIKIWQRIDLSLQNDEVVSDINKLPESDRQLALDISKFYWSNKNNKREVVDKSLNSIMLEYNDNCEFVFTYLMNNAKYIDLLIDKETQCEWGLAADGAAEAAERRSGALEKLSAEKAVVVSEIVKALSENYDKKSVLDGQYNATKLDLFRTYYRAKDMGGGQTDELTRKLAAIEKGHYELINGRK